jgi:hypothetical protein
MRRMNASHRLIFSFGQKEYLQLDYMDPFGALTFVEALPYFTSGINEYLDDNKNLDIQLAFVQADINADGTLSLQEW